MKCKFCGQEVPEGAKECPACGASVDISSTGEQGTGQTQQDSDPFRISGQGGQEQFQYKMTGSGLQSQDQQGQYQFGSSGQAYQSGNGSFGQNYQGGNGSFGQNYQGGNDSFGQNYQGENGTFGQNYQNENGSFNQNYQNQYDPYNSGGQGSYQNGAYGRNQQGQYQYGAPDQSGYAYGRPGENHYGQPEAPVSGTPYMIFAIITTLFCCLPLGIAGIVFACRINPLQKAGDYAGAREEAKKAKLAVIIGMVVGAVVSAVYIGLAIIGFKEYSANDTPSTSAIEERIRNNGADEHPLESADIDDDDEDDPEDDLEDEDEKKPVIQQAEASGELGATWDTFMVQINDKVLTLPCTLGELEAIGLKLDTEDTPENYVVNAREYVYTYFQDANDNEILIDIVNLTDEPKSLGECIIGGVSAYDSDLENGGLSVIFPGGVQMGTPKEEVITKYGETEDFYEDEDYSSYTWYAENAYYSYCEIDIDVETGLVCSMFMQNYGE